MKVMKQKHSRLIAKFEAKNKSLIFNQDSSAFKIMQQVVNELKKDWGKTTEQIMLMMMQLQFEENSGDPIDYDDKKKCAIHITECIRNMSLHLNDKTSRCRYSSHLINISMSVYLKSKSSYDTLRQSGIIQLPHPKVLQRLSQPFKVTEEYDPNVYFSLKNLNSKNKHVMKGHLMMDEIKLKNGILWNCNTNQVTGFVMESLNTNNMMQEILGLDLKKKNDSKQIAVYENRWKFRSTRGYN